MRVNRWITAAVQTFSGKWQTARRHHMAGLTLCVAAGCVVIAAGVDAEEPAALPPAAELEVDYQRHIQPLFAGHCYQCHGPETQESRLRLDRKSGALAGGESGEPALIAGNSRDSHLIRLVSGADPDRVMPPDGGRLTPREIGLLRAWIDQGAVWPETDGHDTDAPRLETDFWSFQPIGAVRPPAVNDPWVATPVDAFILTRLVDAGLSPSRPADRVRLIRRLHLDVLGLPPAPEDVARFLADTRPGGYARLVDRVLANPHYGERWAQHWLDVVRFAETDGFETNIERPDAYHYRDYVIDALNADKPYDRFVFEQLAGDTVGADCATGFLVAGACDRVKSPDLVLTLMQRQDELADVVNTTGTALLGLTLGCARCHNHKFDPVLQSDYYALQAVFAGVEHGSRPLADSAESERKETLARLQEQIATLESEVRELGVRPAVNVRLNEETFAPVSTRFVRFTITETNSGTEPCLDELEIYSVAEEGQESCNVALASAGARPAASGTLAGFAIHKLEHINDGKHHNPNSWISNEPGRGWVMIELAEPARIDRIVWSRDRKNKFQDRLPTRYEIEVSDDAQTWGRVAGWQDRLPYRSGDDGERIATHLPADVVDKAQRLLDEIASVRKTREQVAAEGRTVYAGVFKEPDPTHRLYRGDPMAPREVVTPGGLTVLQAARLPVDTPEQQRRVELARWITGPRNPLTARVLVNRIWHYHFGSGIVGTPSDFGANGGKPSHPELLDWLAGELMQHGWSIKHVHRLILLSNTYRQASEPRKECLSADAANRLLWRFAPRRLEAEAIRDGMLWAAGVLDLRMHGPGFSTFEPNSNYVRVYVPKQTLGPDEWRRMVYMTKIRMELDSVFGAFDCPDAGQVSPKRSRSTTPLQALNLFNSNFVLRQSELFAERLQREAGPETADQVDRAFQLALGRSAAPAEALAAAALADAHGLPAVCRALLNSNEFLFLP